MDLNQFQGSSVLGGGMTLPYLWCSLHLSHTTVKALMNHPNGGFEISRIQENDEHLLKHLQSIEGDTWRTFCTAAGMTAYGAVALSWCKDAVLTQVWEGWKTSGFPLKPLPEFERPARLLNSALLPRTNKLSEIVSAANNSSLAICAIISALKEPLFFDLPRDMLVSAPPQVAAFLKSRMLQTPNRAIEDPALTACWTNTVRGTEFDVWEAA